MMMGKLINELREQARILVSNEERDRGELYGAREQWERIDEKFVELIVSECVDVLIDVLPSIVPESKDGIHPAWHIKDHFGFDE